MKLLLILQIVESINDLSIKLSKKLYNFRLIEGYSFGKEMVDHSMQFVTDSEKRLDIDEQIMINVVKKEIGNTKIITFFFFIIYIIFYNKKVEIYSLLNIMQIFSMNKYQRLIP